MLERTWVTTEHGDPVGAFRKSRQMPQDVDDVDSHACGIRIYNGSVNRDVHLGDLKPTACRAVSLLDRSSLQKTQTERALLDRAVQILPFELHRRSCSH